MAEKGHPPPPTATMNSERFNSKRARVFVNRARLILNARGKYIKRARSFLMSARG